MIKIFLKHFIYDKCLQLLFDNVILNFSVGYDTDQEIISRAVRTWNDSIANGNGNKRPLAKYRNQLAAVLTSYDDNHRTNNTIVNSWAIQDIVYFTKKLQNEIDRMH